jgi:hypothetical protein
MAHKIRMGRMNCILSSPNEFKSIQIFSGEGGKGTWPLSTFIFNVLGSVGWAGAPNFPPHDLAVFACKYKLKSGQGHL